MAELEQTEAPVAHRRSAQVALLVAAAFFMENLDGTVIATALPQMALSFHASPVDLNMGMTAYMLTLAVFIPVSGWMADRLGARTIVSFAIGLFTVASILCGFSNSLAQFTAARILQGMGGAMMVPVGRLVVLRITEKKDLLRSMSVIIWPGLVAPVLGPPLGGFITTYSSWRWIFYLNLPLGIIALGLALWWITNERESNTRTFDWLGFALAGTCCVAFMYSLELMGRRDFQWPVVGLFLGYSVAAGWWAVRHMRRAVHPLIDFAVLRIQTFAVAVWGGSLFRIAIMASPFLLPLLFQVAFGMNAFQSGLLVLTMFAGNLMMKTATTPLLRRFGFRKVLVTNGVISGVLIAGCGFLIPQTPRLAIIVLLFLHGLSRSMQFTSVNTLAFADIPKPLISSATSFAAVVQQMGMGMGVAVGAVMLRAAAWMRGEHTGVLSLMDFHIAFWMVGILALLAVIDCFALPAHAGAEVSGHAVA